MGIAEDKPSPTAPLDRRRVPPRGRARTAPRAPVGSLVGETVDGKYRIDGLLGRGGMGAVYLASHLGTGRAVALKVLAAELTANDDAIERFKREALAAGRIRHPNVVDVTDFGFADRGDERLAYLVMELLRGQTLRARLEASGPLPLDVATDVLSQVCAGIAEAHALGILHRDVKPENIHLEPGARGRYRVKVLDFGIAKLLEPGPVEPSLSCPADRPVPAADWSVAKTLPALAPEPRTAGPLGSGDRALTELGALLGTPRYMAPEQWMGRAVDARTDVYSFGVLAYEMLTGNPPFLGSGRSLVMEHQSHTPPSLAAKAPFVPRGVVRVIESALAKDPADRPTSASAFAAVLHAGSETTGTLIRESIALCLEHYWLFFRPASFLSIPALVFAALALASSLLARAGLVSSRVDLWLGAGLLQLPPLILFPVSVALVGLIVPLVADVSMAHASPRPPASLAKLWPTLRRSLPTSLVKLGLVASVPPLVLLPIVKLAHLEPRNLPTYSALALAAEGLAYTTIAPFILTGPIVAVEGLRGLAPLRRSAKLVRPMLRTAVGVLLVWHLLYVAVSISFALASTTLAGIRLEDALEALRSDRLALVRSAAWRASIVLQAALFVVLGPLALIPGALLYLRAREAAGDPFDSARGR